MFVAALAVGGVSLLACSRPALKAQGEAQAATATTSGPATSASVSGFAACAACGNGDRGDRLVVQLIDAAEAAAAPLLAEVSVGTVRSQRIPFALAIDARWAAAGRTLALRATLRDASGRLRAATARKTTLTTPPSASVELVLVPVSVN